MNVLGVLTPISGIIEKVLDKFLPSDLDKAQKDKVKAEANAMLVDSTLKEESEFRDFLLEFEGRASDLGPFMASFRASLRPVISYAVYITVVYRTWVGLDIPQMMWNLTLIVTAFWFGERAIRNIAPAIKDMMNK